MAGFPKLFEPLQLGKMHLRNRIVMPGMGTNLADEDGNVTQQLIDHYKERARGGAGLIIVESCAVIFPQGKNIARSPSVDSDKFLPGLSKLAQEIKKHGARAALQLNHGGRHAATRFTGMEPVAPSPTPMRGSDMPRELPVEEIEHIISCFAQAAARAKQAGFDGVEIHAAHDYLLSEFLSGAANKRGDKYGGEHANRARLLVEVIRAVRGEVGGDFTVWCRIDGAQYGLEGGTTIEESKETARMAQEAGADAIHVSAYGEGSGVMVMTPDTPGYLVPLASTVKKVVTVPVIGVGRLDYKLGEKIIAEGNVDLISLGRRLIADPDLPNKVAEGRFEDIRPCTACLACIDAIAFKDAKVQCRINASARKEEGYQIKPIEKVRKVLVIGGGPAGMEAARVAALRGHHVTLYEKSRRLGGKLLLAAVLDSKKEDIIRYLGLQVKKLNVDLHLGEEFNTAALGKDVPDAIVIATGAKPGKPELNGIERGDVISPLNIQQMMTGELKTGSLSNQPAWRRIFWYVGNSTLKYLPLPLIRFLTRVWLPFGNRVVIIGGNMAGCQLADFLLARGRKVTIVEPSSRLAGEMEAIPRYVLTSRLAQSGVVMLRGIQCEAITDRGLEIINPEKKHQTIEADTIVFNTALSAETKLLEALKGKVPGIYLAGDSHGTNVIIDAIRDGYRIGNSI
ncbi:FAD-dependent oxidoreductase [Chloroflexota bacterium]